MTPAIREATARDLSALVPLFKEMEDHYEGSAALGLREVRTRLAHWLETNRDSVMLVAFAGDRPLGHAVLCPLFPAGDLTTAWFLKDIYVRAEARGTGIGAQLIRACGAETLRRNGTRLDLTVDAGNDSARRLYEALGARDTAKRYLRWEGSALDDLCREGTISP